MAGEGTGLGRGMTVAMAVACGVAVANIYYNQPLLGLLQRDFPGQAAMVGFVPTATQLGYATGIFLLVPLGDVVERRRLILGQLGLLVLALLAVALSPSAGLLLVASVLVGITATAAQVIIPFAAELADPARRGSTVGTLMSGLLCGILFGRTLAGFVGEHFGWRATFATGIVLVLGAGLLLAAALPRGTPRARISYPALLASLFAIVRQEPRLRRATAIQTAMFAAFSVFWTVLALRLEGPPYRAGADVAGLFGLLGGFGVLAAPLLGRVADRRGPGFGISFGTTLMLCCWLLLGLSATWAAIVIAVVALDVGVQCTMISNQHVIFALRPEARSRINTVFVCGLFLGGSLGSAGAILCWRTNGWPAVCAYGGALTAVAIALNTLGGRKRRIETVA